MALRMRPGYAAGEHTIYHSACASQTYREKKVVPGNALKAFMSLFKFHRLWCSGPRCPRRLRASFADIVVCWR